MFLGRKKLEELHVEEYRAVVTRLLEWGCSEVGMSHILPNITWEFSSRMRTTMGTAQTDFAKKGGHIKFCTVLFIRAEKGEAEKTILHELAHILANIRAGRRVAHGWQWKQMMINLGQPPERCHKVDTEGVKRRQRRFRVLCTNECELTLTSSKRTRMLNSGMRYHCPRCSGRIGSNELNSAEEIRRRPT